VEGLDAVADPVEYTEQHPEVVCRFESGRLDGVVGVRRRVEVSSRFSGRWVTIPATLPDTLVPSFEVVDGVVPTLEPANVESCVRDREWVLAVVEGQFESAWREAVGLEHPPIDE